MNKERVLIILVIILAIMNLALVAFFFVKGGPNGPRAPRMSHEKAEMRVKNNFGFDESQMAAFKKSRDTYGQSIHQIQAEIKELSEQYYLLADEEKTLKDSLLQRLNVADMEVYKLNNQHFEDFRNIASKDQKPKVDQFIKTLLHRKPH